MYIKEINGVKTVEGDLPYHNHDPETLEKRTRKMVRAMVIKGAYNKEGTRHQVVTKALNFPPLELHPILDSREALGKVYDRAAKRRRDKDHENDEQGNYESVETLQIPESVVTLCEEILLVIDHKEEGEPEFRMPVFGSRRNLRKLKEWVDAGWVRLITGDGTFKSCFNLFDQDYGIGCDVRGFDISLLRFLLTGRSRKHYKILLKVLLHLLAQVGITQAQWEAFIWSIDFEKGMLSELQELSLRAGGCFFHFMQTNIRQIDKLGLRDRFDNNFAFRLRVYMITSIGFMWPELMPVAYDRIGIQFEDIEFPYLDYFGNNFIGRQIAPRRGVALGRAEPRYPPSFWTLYFRFVLGLDLTTCAREREHGLTNQNAGCINPDFDGYTEILKLREGNNNRRVAQIERGERRKPSLDMVNRSLTIGERIEELKTDTRQTDRFLKQVALWRLKWTDEMPDWTYESPEQAAAANVGGRPRQLNSPPRAAASSNQPVPPSPAPTIPASPSILAPAPVMNAPRTKRVRVTGTGMKEEAPPTQSSHGNLFQNSTPSQPFGGVEPRRSARIQIKSEQVQNEVQNPTPIAEPTQMAKPVGIGGANSDAEDEPSQQPPSQMKPTAWCPRYEEGHKLVRLSRKALGQAASREAGRDVGLLITCDACKVPMSTTSGYIWNCEACDYDVCYHCLWLDSDKFKGRVIWPLKVLNKYRDTWRFEGVMAQPPI